MLIYTYLYAESAIIPSSSLSQSSCFWLDVHHVPIGVLHELNLCVSQGEVCWLVVSHCLLHFFYIFRIIWVIQSLPESLLTLPDIQVPSLSVLIGKIIQLVVHVDSSLLEMCMGSIMKNSYRTCPKIQAIQLMVVERSVCCCWACWGLVFPIFMP